MRAAPLLLAFALGCSAEVKKEPAPSGPKEGPAMPEPVVSALPFGLTKADLDAVEIRLALYRSKTGAGREEIVVRGDGKVRLVKTLSYNSPEEVLEGSVPVPTFVRLLEVFEDEGVPGYPEVYPSKDQPPARTFMLTFKCGGKEKQVAAQDWEPQSFARVSGAIRVVAAIARPEALKKRFFNSL